MPTNSDSAKELVDHLFRSEYGRMVSVLTSVFGFAALELAEDVVQETLLVAFRQWSYGQVPDEPRAWLMRVAKNKAINRLKHDGTAKKLAPQIDASRHQEPAEVFLATDIEDSVLRMMFTCSHPEIAQEAQIALVLKTLCGFSSGEVAAALLITEQAANKRIYRAKEEIRRRKIRYEVPGGYELEQRLRSVCTSIYLLFNEGYNSTHAETLIRKDLCLEAMRLCKLLRARFPTEPALAALLSLMCFHVARFDSRIDEAGALVILEDQDRSLWNQGLIRQACLLLGESAQGQQLSRYHLEASIAAQHCLASSFDETNWQQIEAFYTSLYALVPNPILQLNLAIIASRTQSLAVAIDKLKTLKTDKFLARYGLLHATLGEFHRLEGALDDAQQCFETALSLTKSGPQRAFLEGKLRLLHTQASALPNSSRPR